MQAAECCGRGHGEGTQGMDGAGPLGDAPTLSTSCYSPSWSPQTPCPSTAALPPRPAYASATPRSCGLAWHGQTQCRPKSWAPSSARCVGPAVVWQEGGLWREPECTFPQDLSEATLFYTEQLRRKADMEPGAAGGALSEQVSCWGGARARAGSHHALSHARSSVWSSTTWNTCARQQDRHFEAWPGQRGPGRCRGVCRGPC